MILWGLLYLIPIAGGVSKKTIVIKAAIITTTPANLKADFCWEDTSATQN
ncbi:MAG: hypothetical protein WC650_02000 [Candidatus Doudnabacteria bacterium]